ncbi:Hypothetical predicted protein [Cloeon dipterum]|uniref:Peptidase S1 domain-containing protein n=1 Tax=Cloeon dipterum TaxID=197152 RepID=A0A8S1C956_9INSE|nr:Hypothetical predicted protein [Cloeon dipterum]
MKAFVALVFFFAATQATDWHNIHPRYSFKQTANSVGKTSRIIGGEIASAGQFPFQAGLVLDGFAFCGGSLIKEDVVLTSARCCINVGVFEVHLGAQNIYDLSEPNHVVHITSDRAIHMYFNDYTLENDICVVRMRQFVTGEGITPVRLPSRSQVAETFDGELAVTSGWGLSYDFAPNLSDELRFVNVTVMSNYECSTYFGPNIVPCQMCIDTKFGSSGICSGDSGGPLIITEDDGNVTQVALSSFFSSAGCESGSPHGFTRLTCYLSWLETYGGVTIRP